MKKIGTELLVVNVLSNEFMEVFIVFFLVYLHLFCTWNESIVF